MREYNVILKEGIDYDGFWDDIESDTDGGKLYIPNRRVEFTNERPASLRQCWYLLTDEEAEQLKLDDRVFDVEIPPEHRTDIIIAPRITQTGNFSKTTSDTGDYINWGLIRSNFLSNIVYGTSNDTTSSFNYTLAGAGVDVVIQDSGIQTDHPEFQGLDGVNRVQQINWATESGLAFTQNANHYRDYDGHGTHVAGIIAGKRYGWAKRANIYSQKLSGLEGSGDSGTGISPTYAFDAIKLWHRNKPIQPNTGAKRPTIVNMSWGYLDPYDSVSSINYRGVTYSGTAIDTATEREQNYGLINVSGASLGYNYITNVRVASTDTDIQEMVDEGIIVVIAAGNFGHKIDVSGGPDYNNYAVTDQGTLYYHRGSSPYYTGALKVGNLDSSVLDANTDRKAISSETGPGVDIYAPGTNIMSACSNTNSFGAQSYDWNASYTQVNISGTSMAAPQVAGVVALMLEANPKATPASIKTALLANSTGDMYSTFSNNNWTDRRNVWGGSPRVLYNKFNAAESKISGEIVLNGGVVIKTR
jgi:subtilisin family serine protease